MSDTVGAVHAKVAEALEVAFVDITLWFDGSELGDMSIGVSETGLVEGCTVDARPSKSFEATMELAAMGMVCCADELRQVIVNDETMNAEEKARIAQLMVDCDEGEYFEKALLAAAERGYSEVVSVLAPACNDVDECRAYNGRTALQLASKNGATEAVRALLARGANPNVAIKNGKTSLHWAASNGHIEIVKLLITNGANANWASSDGKTPMHRAAENGHNDVASLLSTEKQ
eukprot:TRINITY_DN34684_c0_g1_i1.p1 TRINITY_DN34684_c0_g1~~TRINITY_DN34684_c0_g1_i1.p1  ORF type:complete len:254 (+),score=51.74 TRINITY_DN34684_c0_g1_i1:67-762(+)